MAEPIKKPQFTKAQIEAEIQRRANKKVQSVNQQEQQMQQPVEMPQAEYQENPFMSGVVGFNTAIERPVQGLMQLVTGDKWKGLQDTARKREAKYARSSAQNPGSTLTGDILGNLGLGAATGGGFTSLAGKIAPVVKSSSYLQNILGSILGGGAFGGAQYVEPNESRLGNTLEGAGIGGGISAALPGLGRAVPMAGRAFSRAVAYPGRMMKDFLEDFTPAEMRLALDKDAAAKKLGVKLTPAEAAENNIAAATEGRLGTSKHGKRTLYEFKKEQKDLEDKAIQKMIASVSKNPANAYEEIRNSAKKIIKDREKALQAKAKPFYDAANPIEIESSKLKELTNNGIIEKELKAVIEEPKYRKQVEGKNVNSIEVLNIVKKRIDGLIGAANKSGNLDDARLFTEAKNELVSELDKVSLDYQKARAIYAEDSPIVDLLRKREVGKISRLNDDQIKQVGNIIFDPAQTDLKELARMAKEFHKENPKAWDRIIRNYLENTIDTKYKGRTGYHGTNFYNQFLAQDKSFNKLNTALSHNPEAQQTLKDMRLVFNDITNQPTVKGAKTLSAGAIDMARSTYRALQTMASNLTGGHYDKAMVEIITTDKWQKAFEKALKEPTKEARNMKIMNLMDNVTHQIGKGEASRRTATKGPFRGEDNND